MIRSARVALVVFFLIVFLGPVVVAPLLNLALQPLGIPFHRVMARSLLLCALGALVLCRGRLELRIWWPMNSTTGRQLGRGFLLAVVSSAVMIGLYSILCGVHAADIPFSRVVLSMITALVAAFIVPVLEETIFRGFLATAFVETTGRRVGWLLAAGIYALAHFLRVPPETAGQTSPWWSGAAGMIFIFTHLGQGEFLTGRGLNLFFVGLILGGIFLRSGTLWINTALHGGWIFILMSFSAFTRPVEPPRFTWLGDDLLASPITSAVLLILGVFLWRFYPGEAMRQNSG